MIAPKGFTDTSNQFEVIVRGDVIVINAPVSGFNVPPISLTRDQAINLAAWLSMLADPAGNDFFRVASSINPPASPNLSEEAHKARHAILHRMFDELMTDWIGHTNALPSSSSVADLLKWSAGQIDNPT